MSRKTYKREVAMALLVWLAYVVETKDANIIEILVWPIFTFVGLAFGMDWFGKSGGMRNPSEFITGRGNERSSEHPTRSGEQPDSRPVEQSGTDNR